MSDTPRTDAAVHPTQLLRRADGTSVEIVAAVTCRQLERELAEAQAEITRLKGEAESWEKVFDRTCEHLAEANARLDWLDTVECRIYRRGYGEYWHYYGAGFPKIREIIDAAMKEGK